MEDEMTLANQQTLDAMRQSGCFDITSCDSELDLDDKNKFTKLDITSAQKMQISALIQNVPAAFSAGMLANAYTVSFPEGLPHALTALKQGGFGSMVRVDGKFAGSASFFEMSAQASLLGAFTAMSVATGQYFMAQISSELKLINLKMDKILEFLYGDKKAELMSEISFVQYAYQNFSSIMTHEAQRIAMISSLQEAKKVSMKDIEFYLGDLDSKAVTEAKNYSSLERLICDSFQIRESLALSIQLYIMSNLLEMQYAQNMDKEFVSYMETEITAYIEKCDKRILSSFSSLKGRLDSYKAKKMEKVDKVPFAEKLSVLIDSLNDGEESSMKKAVRSVLQVSEKNATYYVKQDGNVYIMRVG